MQHGQADGPEHSVHDPLGRGRQFPIIVAAIALPLFVLGKPRKVFHLPTQASIPLPVGATGARGVGQAELVGV